MSDFMYRWVVRLGRPAFALSSSPVVLHRERADFPGGYLLAATHFSPYDVPCLMKESPRPLDFVSITEVYRNPFVARFFNAVNAFPLDRSRPDAPTVRIILDRLARGRVVAMFPEGRIRSEADSVLNGGDLEPGVARIARLADVPAVPTCIIGTGAYSRPSSWLPLRRTHFGVAFGRPLRARVDVGESESVEELLADIKRSYRELHAELLRAMREVRPGFWHRPTHGAGGRPRREERSPT